MMDPRDLPTEVAYRRLQLLRSARKRRPRKRQARRRLLPASAGRPAQRFVTFDASQRRCVLGHALLGASAAAALLAAVGALLASPGKATETVLIDAWWALGVAVFGGLFAPRGPQPHELPRCA